MGTIGASPTLEEFAAYYVFGLRELANFFESNPTFVPSNRRGLEIHWKAEDENPSDPAAAFVSMSRAMPKANHVVDDRQTVFSSQRLFGPHRYSVTREVRDEDFPARVAIHPATT